MSDIEARVTAFADQLDGGPLEGSSGPYLAEALRQVIAGQVDPREGETWDPFAESSEGKSTRIGAGSQHLSDRWNQQNVDTITARLAEGCAVRDDWRQAISDTLQNIQRIVYRAGHPDDVDDARSAVSSLLGLWLSVDEADELHLHGRSLGG